jgi:antitoxin component YwqK of YwqJK toxin-antitoxin module
MKILFLFLTTLLLFGCSHKANHDEEPVLSSIQIIDRNGFSETVSAKDRLAKYQKVNFLEPQPYQKVLRVFKKDDQGKSHSSVTSYHSNGHIWQSLEVLDGRAHGNYTEWYPNGHKKMEINLIEGIADLSDRAFASWIFEGKNQIWDEMGYLVAEIFYEKGVLQGESVYYHKNGSIKKKIPYLQDKIEGNVTVYGENGDLLESFFFVNDLPNGKCHSYNKDQSLLLEEEWKEGKLLFGTYFGLNQTILSTLSNGSGERAEFEEGVLKRWTQYQEGIPKGTVKCLDEKGDISSIYHQKDGKKHGEEIIYYTGRNQPKILLSWQEDILQGTVKTWFIDGTQESQKEMYQNKKNGTSLAWYKNGNLMLMEEYENDLLVSGSYYKKGDKKPISRINNKKGTATLYDPDGYFLKKIPYEKGLPLLEGEE